eukprot:TRINITY_DN2707_c0_g4_i4.p1 TRINITY_DN2707_c0_g4~~TRINITY_DN2707_c0_g4_i4.p1  ORF type:complete len:112 (-),score=12.09 TRINITY_DN2707_c0_g4_i4:150-485(-)
MINYVGWINNKTKLSQEYLSYFGKTMVDSIRNQIPHPTTLFPTKHGYFLPSCFDHTGNLCPGSATRVRGYNFTQVLYDWYWKKNTIPHTLLDACWEVNGQPCDTVCPTLCG